MKKRSNILVIFIIGVVICGGYYYANGVTTEGYFNIEKNDLLEEDGSYYIFLEESKIEITEDLFKKIKVNHHYQIKYKWNKLFPNHAKIERIAFDS